MVYFLLVASGLLDVGFTLASGLDRVAVSRVGIPSHVFFSLLYLAATILLPILVLMIWKDWFGYISVIAIFLARFPGSVRDLEKANKLEAVPLASIPYALFALKLGVAMAGTILTVSLFVDYLVTRKRQLGNLQ